MFENHIFVIGEFINSETKEKTLISLIERLKIMGIPILLTGHYPVKPEIQEMVDYYFFDKNNPVLNKYNFHKYNLVSKTLWAKTGEWRAEFSIDSPDYAIWKTMKNAFNFCNSLGKDVIHFLEYDNLPDIIQYENEFILPLENYDASVFEVLESGIKIDRYKTFLFSIKTNVAISLFNSIQTEEEYYTLHDENFLLEDVFFKYLNNLTNNIYISKYFENKLELDIHSQFDGEKLTNFLVCSQHQKLYVVFLTKLTMQEFTITVDYDRIKNDYLINKGYLMTDHMEYVHEIGDYEVGKTVRIYHNDSEVTNITLDMDWQKFRVYNKIDIYGA